MDITNLTMLQDLTDRQRVFNPFEDSYKDPFADNYIDGEITCKSMIAFIAHKRGYYVRTHAFKSPEPLSIMFHFLTQPNRERDGYQTIYFLDSVVAKRLIESYATIRRETNLPIRRRLLEAIRQNAIASIDCTAYISSNAPKIIGKLFKYWSINTAEREFDTRTEREPHDGLDVYHSSMGKSPYDQQRLLEAIHKPMKTRNYKTFLVNSSSDGTYT